jgi:DNA-binding FadR family transcriptional regulator
MDTNSSLERRIAVKRAHEHITRLIASRVLDPGDPLPSAAKLSKDIGVSRPVVLDSFRVLESEGKLTVGRGPSGVRLAHPEGPQSKAKLAWLKANGDMIRQMVVLREFIEPGIAKLVAEQGMPRDLLQRGRRIIHEFNERPSARQVLLRLDAEFHKVLAQATGMPVLQEASQNCRVWVSPAFDFLDWPPDRLGQAAMEHEAILDAIERRDPHGASAATLAHLQVSSRLIARKLTEISRGDRKKRSGA